MVSRVPSRALMLLLVCAMAFTMAAQAADVVARLDRSDVIVGETVTLILQTNDPEQSLDADLQDLEADFLLLDQRSESQMSIVNGRQTAVVRRLITLEPRRPGRLRVPSLTLGAERTDPIELTVRPAPQPAPGEPPPVFIELALAPPNGPYYVHAQLSLTVKIFYQQNLTEASITPPAPEQASVRLLDEVPFPAERNGVRYRVLQRRYALFPERSGTLVIPPMRLSGRLVDRSSDRLWQPSVRGRRLTEESEALSIEILPRPGNFGGTHWLPARDVQMTQQVSQTDALKVGEPVTRTVIVDAVGLEENMLEEPEWPPLDHARIYPDQPQGISRDDGQWVRGHKEFRYAVVPEQAGELVLPELRLPWWDTVSDTARVAVLPEVVIQVTAPQIPAGPAAPSPMASGRAGAPGAGPAPGAGIWRPLAMAFATLWLLTLFLWWRRPASGAARPQGAAPGTGERELLTELKSACAAGDAARTRMLLRRWVAGHGPDWADGSVMQLAAGLDDEDLKRRLQQFDAAGFGPSPQDGWDGKGLWRSFDRWRRRQAPDAAATVRPDLYAPRAGQ